MTRFIIMFMFTFVSLTVHLDGLKNTENEPSYVEEACSGTQYPDICITSLAPFSKIAQRNTSTWARAGVSVTLSEAKNVTKFLLKLRDSGSIRGKRNKLALSDCIELFEEALDDLHRSLTIVRNLDTKSFNVQINDLTTYTSAVLSDKETCLDGFDEAGNGKYAKMVRNQVRNVTCLTSNALALINKLATTGL